MLYPIYGPIAAAPSLHLQLQHIARSPAARLGISYQIVTHRFCHPPLRDVLAAGLHHALAHEGEVADVIADRALARPFVPTFCLGNAIYLDSLLAGGVDGQPLPMSICARLERYLQPAPLGMLADVHA